jgi:hypothetical protein
MTDYTKATGSSGTMMIRDVGNGWVEFWLKAGSSTFNHQLPWAYTAPTGFSGWMTKDFVSGGAWQLLGSVFVSTSGNVTFHLGSSGTSGLGGPTDFTVFMQRATVPPAPTMNSATTQSSSVIRVIFSGNGDGGSPILEWRIGYGSDPNGAQFFTGSSGTTDIGGLASGVTYYFWAQGRNALGWGAWSGRIQATTWKLPDAPGAVVLSDATQISVKAVFTGNGEGGTPVVQWQIAYGTDPVTPQIYVDGYNMTISPLDPGTTYYFWSRGRNAVGWSPLSAVRSITTIAGAYLKVGTVYKTAVPYVKVAGVWTLARPWARAAGVWKEST